MSHCLQSRVESVRLVSGQGFVSSFKWIPTELIHSDKGCRFFDRDYDSSNSGLTRSSPTRTSDQDCLPSSMMHLDGEFGFGSHIHVPCVSVQSRVPPDVLSDCTGVCGSCLIPMVSRAWDK